MYIARKSSAKRGWSTVSRRNALPKLQNCTRWLSSSTQTQDSCTGASHGCTTAQRRRSSAARLRHPRQTVTHTDPAARPDTFDRNTAAEKPGCRASHHGRGHEQQRQPCAGEGVDLLGTLAWPGAPALGW